MAAWVVVTGGGSGIGRALVHHFCRDHPVVTCGRRADALEETRRLAGRPQAVTIVACDVGLAEGRAKLLDALPKGSPIRLLVQNAAIGDPALLQELDIAHFEEALRVNVVAPLALTQALMPQLLAGRGRVLHLGTSVAHVPQRGTATYGITKAAFHRLYQQLNAEQIGIPVSSLSPGLVDTDGVRDHVKKARRLDLAHVSYFDRAFDEGWTTDMEQLMGFVDELLLMEGERFSSQEWRFSEWRKTREASCKQSDAAPSSL